MKRPILVKFRTSTPLLGNQEGTCGWWRRGGESESCK